MIDRQGRENGMLGKVSWISDGDPVTQLSGPPGWTTVIGGTMSGPPSVENSWYSIQYVPAVSVTPENVKST